LPSSWLKVNAFDLRTKILTCQTAGGKFFSGIGEYCRIDRALCLSGQIKLLQLTEEY